MTSLLFDGPLDDAWQYKRVIVAGSDEDVSASDIIEWMSPLLAGIPGRRWQACQIDLASPNGTLAHFICGSSAQALSFEANWTEEEKQQFLGNIPDCENLTMITLDDHADQAVALLDELVSWLGLFDLREMEMGPIAKLFDSFARAVQSIAIIPPVYDRASLLEQHTSLC